MLISVERLYVRETVLSISVDSVENLYVLNSGPSGLSVEAFGPSVSGNIAPAIQFTLSSVTSMYAQLALR
jgi:hypothetical protein